MGKEWAVLIIGLGVEITVTIFGVVVKNMPLLLAIIGWGFGLFLIVWGIIGLFRNRSASKDKIQPVTYSYNGRQNLTTPKVASVELSIPKVVFTIEQGNTNKPQIHIEPFLLPTGGSMLLESAKVEIAGLSEPCYDWRILDLWPGQTSVTGTHCKVPDNLSKGQHTIRLLIYANKEWWTSEWATINYEPSTLDKEGSQKQ